MLDILKVTLVFGVIILLLRRKINLGIAMIIASVVLSLLYSMSIPNILKLFLITSIESNTLTLISALLLIVILENIIRKNMLLQKMVTSLKGLLKDRRLVMAILPAFIGFLPSVGGAIFSAPMVEETSQGMSLTAEKKSFVNYWYRHIWEFIFPLYPGIILAAKLLQVSMRQLILVQYPFSLTAAIIGLPIAFRGIDNYLSETESKNRKQYLKDLALGVSPILSALILVFVVGLDISISLSIVVVSLMIIFRYSYKQVIEALRESISLKIIFLVLGIMIFKNTLIASGAVDALPQALMSLGIPRLLIFMILPLTIGVLTGSTQAFVGATFPMLLGIAGAGGLNLRLLAFAFVSGYAGVMLSPTHVCLILTLQHFKADFSKVYKMLLLPETAIVSLAAILYLLFS